MQNYDSPSMGLFTNDDLLQFINVDDTPGLFCPTTGKRHPLTTPGIMGGNGATVPAPGSELMTLDLLGTVPKQQKSPLKSPNRMDLSMGIAGHRGGNGGMDHSVLRMMGYKGTGADTPLTHRPPPVPMAIPLPAPMTAAAPKPKRQPKNTARAAPPAPKEVEPMIEVTQSFRVDENYKQHPWALGTPESGLIFAEVINFKRQLRQQNCVMCGLDGKKEVQIPAQNKDVCKSCDTAFWHCKAHDVVVKFCKGCKNFVPLGEFEDKPEASKCGKCRQRGRQNYFARKKTNSKPDNHDDTGDDRDLDHSKGRGGNNGRGNQNSGNQNGGNTPGGSSSGSGGSGGFHIDTSQLSASPLSGRCITPAGMHPQFLGTPSLSTKGRGKSGSLGRGHTFTFEDKPLRPSVTSKRTRRGTSPIAYEAVYEHEEPESPFAGMELPGGDRGRWQWDNENPLMHLANMCTTMDADAGADKRRADSAHTLTRMSSSSSIDDLSLWPVSSPESPVSPAGTSLVGGGGCEENHESHDNTSTESSPQSSNGSDDGSDDQAAWEALKSGLSGLKRFHLPSDCCAVAKLDTAGCWEEAVKMDAITDRRTALPVR
jgi:hypothetical protein